MKSKRLLVTLLAATMAFSSLAGCSGSSGSSSAQNTGDGSSAGGSASAGIMNETGLPIVNEPVTLTMLVPLLHILARSLSDPSQSGSMGGLEILPRGFSLINYEVIFSNKNLVPSIFNSIFITLVGTACSLAITLMYAFAISMPGFRHANKFSFFAYFTMLFNGGMLPWYILCTQYYHLANTVWGLFLPYGMNVFNMFLMRNYLKTIPASIYEAARIDGAGYGTIFFRVTLPLSQVGMITVGLFYGLSYWNDFYLPLMLITDDSLTTMQYLLYRMMGNLQFLVSNSNSSMVSNITPPMQTAKMAMSVLAIGPIILVYPFIQKYFVKGVIVGAIKG